MPDEIVPFTVGDGATFDEVIGAGSAIRAHPLQAPLRRPRRHPRDPCSSGPWARSTPRWRPPLSTVGDLRDLEADGRTRSTPDELAAEVQRLLRSKPYRYLLILGNDDAVPYFRVENPLGEEERASLADWQLPNDWVATDNYYTDLDADEYGVPDLPVARIPSSDDAALLLKQLGENQPPTVVASRSSTSSARARPGWSSTRSPTSGRSACSTRLR